MSLQNQESNSIKDRLNELEPFRFYLVPKDHNTFN